MKIGYVLVIANYGDIGHTPGYAETRDGAIAAEAAGFDSVWLYDHLLYRFVPGAPTIGIWECWSLLAALAEATSRVELGTLVICNSFRNPGLLAKMAVTVDEISQGRLILGVGAGWNQPEYDAFGIAFDHRVGRLEEALQIVSPLLKEGRADFRGRYYSATDCEIVPAGPRPGGPPLMVGAMGPRMMELTATYGDIWNTAYMGTPESFAGPLADFRAACERVGRDPASIEVTATVALQYPDLGRPVPLGEQALAGSAEEIAAAFAGYEALGVSHLMIHASPYGADAFERLVEAVEIYRRN